MRVNVLNTYDLIYFLNSEYILICMKGLYYLIEYLHFDMLGKYLRCTTSSYLLSTLDTSAIFELFTGFDNEFRISYLPKLFTNLKNFLLHKNKNWDSFLDFVNNLFQYLKIMRTMISNRIIKLTIYLPIP